MRSVMDYSTIIRTTLHLSISQKLFTIYELHGHQDNLWTVRWIVLQNLGKNDVLKNRCWTQEYTREDQEQSRSLDWAGFNTGPA